MRDLFRDLRFGLRVLSRAPGTAGLSVVILALAIAAATAIFGVVGAVLAPLPFDEAAELVVVWETNQQRGWDRYPVARARFVDWKERSRDFEDLAAYRSYELNLSGGDRPVRVRVAEVTANFFGVLGVQPVPGRAFLAAEEEPGAEQVTIISDGLWRSRFGSDPGVIGSTVRLDGVEHTVVGIAPAGMEHPPDVALWRPMALAPDLWRSRVAHGLAVIGRLDPGSDLATARANLQLIASDLARAYPDTDAGWSVEVASLRDELLGEVEPVLTLLAGAVGLLLLIASANVGGLFLAEARRREREFGIRKALGAGGGRLLRQVLTESLLLSLAAGSLGVLVSVWATDLLLAMSPVGPPRGGQVEVDGGVLGFALALSLLTGSIFGAAPAIGAARTEPQASLKGGGMLTPSGRVGRGILAAQIALALVLLVGAGLLGKSLWRLQRVDPGFEAGNLLTLRVQPSSSRGSAARAALYTEIRQALKALPGVDVVGGISHLPFTSRGEEFRLRVEGRPVEAFAELPTAQVRAVAAGYFRAMRIPLLEGRLLQESDGADAPPVLLVNKAMADRFWPGRPVVGQRISISGADGPWLTIVGVVADVRHFGLDRDAAPEMYLPYTQEPWPGMTFVLRSDGDPLQLAGPARAAIHAVDPDQPVTEVSTMELLVSGSMARDRFISLMIFVFAAAAVILAAAGLYGLVSHAVTSRRRELGIRIALGARPGEVVALMLSQGMRSVAWGAVLGFVGALAAGRMIGGLLHGVAPGDPWVLAATTVLLTLVALLASFVPARRVTRIDPAGSLRAER